MNIANNAEAVATEPAAAGTDVPASIGGPAAEKAVLAKAWLKTGTGIFTSLITLLAASLTVIFLLVPSLKPSAPVTELGATLSDARIETAVGLGDYYARIGKPPPASVSQDDLAKTGVVVSFTTVIQGYKGKVCSVVWSVFDATTNRRSDDAWLVAQPGWPAQYFTPAANKDQGNGEIYVQDPPDPGTYFARIELIDPAGTRLATIDSPTFEVGGTTAPPAPAGLPTASGS